MCVSILIPFYNTPLKYFKECLESIERQSFKLSLEIIIVNDGSDDNLVIEVKNFITTLHQKYIIYDLDKNYGIAYALNYGLQKCKYNLIARMDGDDIMKIDRIQKQYDYFQEHKNTVLLGGQIDIMEESTGKIKYTTSHPNIITKDIVKKKSLIWFLNHPTVMFKKNIIHRMGFYPTHLQGHSEDTFLWLKLLHHNYTLHNLDDIILTYRDCPHSLSHNFKYDVKKDILNWIQSI